MEVCGLLRLPCMRVIVIVITGKGLLLCVLTFMYKRDKGGEEIVCLCAGVSGCRCVLLTADLSILLDVHPS